MLPRKGGVEDSLYTYPGGELGFSNNWTSYYIALYYYIPIMFIFKGI